MKCFRAYQQKALKWHRFEAPGQKETRQKEPRLPWQVSGEAGSRAGASDSCSSVPICHVWLRAAKKEKKKTALGLPGCASRRKTRLCEAVLGAFREAAPWNEVEEPQGVCHWPPTSWREATHPFRAGFCTALV